MDKILHDLKDSKLWKIWYIPYYGSCRILSINRRVIRCGLKAEIRAEGSECRVQGSDSEDADRLGWCRPYPQGSKGPNN